MTVTRARLGAVELAWIDSAASRHPPAAFFAEVGMLGDQQARRCRTLSGARAERFLIGRWLMAELITRVTGEPAPTLTSTCLVCGGDHGAPVCTNAAVVVSVSYADSIVAAAAVSTTDAAAVGIDVARVSQHEPGARLHELARLFAPEPPPDLRGWTMIEAAAKADGRGLRIGPEQIVIRPAAPGEGGILPDRSFATIPGRTDPIEVAAAPGPAGCLLSVAVARTAAVR